MGEVYLSPALPLLVYVDDSECDLRKVRMSHNYYGYVLVTIEWDTS